jgi:hypothetical protein
MVKSDITYFLCGGTGINIGLALKANSRTSQNQNATLVGLDTSDANSSDEKFPVERMPGTEGSGKRQAENYEAAQPFVKNVMAKYRSGKYAVVVANTAGGSGSMFSLLVIRHLIAQGIPTLFCAISDHTSTIEFGNAVGTLRNISNQVKKELLDAPIAFLDNVNDANSNRGEVNAKVVERLDLASLFFTGANGEMDYADVKNFFFYNRVSNVPPAMSEVSFYDQDSAARYQGKTPVAVASLFEDSDSVIPMFQGTTYRTTGVFQPDITKPKGMTQLHMVLDHGEAIEKLQAQIQSLEDHKSNQAVTYVKQKDLGSNNADANGIDFG